MSQPEGRPSDTNRQPPHLAVGRRGEQVAADHLKSLGYRVLSRNVRAAGGELDIVALQGGTVVFCEVKSRLGEAAAVWERVDAKKRRSLLRAARAFLRRKHLQDAPYRFDIVTVSWPSFDLAEVPQVRVYRNAFSGEEDEGPTG